MTLDDFLTLSNRRERPLTWTLQLVLAGLIIVGLVTTRFEMVATESIALGITLLPALLRREYGHLIHPAEFEACPVGESPVRTSPYQ